MGPVSLDVGGRQVEVTHPDKVIFPGHNGRAGHTKLDLI
jgi:DNA primase